MFSKEIFAETLKYLRTSQNLKQSDIAEFLGVTITQISDMERGRRTTTIENIAKLAEYYNVPADYLLTGETDMEIKHTMSASLHAEAAITARINALSDKGRRDLEEYLKLIEMRDKSEK